MRFYVLRGVRCLIPIVILTCLTGCQWKTGGIISASLFYPDQIGQKKVGDPRRPMYEASGYTESDNAGTDAAVVKDGFRGMNQEGGK
jgi:hypothetical protein